VTKKVKEVQDGEITRVIDVGYDRVTDSRKRKKTLCMFHLCIVLHMKVKLETMMFVVILVTVI
jgi:hypothetical protein